MSRIRQKGTAAEIELRKALYSRGLRYRLHVSVLTKPRRVPDLIFARARVAVFVDGCFWHGCPKHASWPKANASFWREKIEANRSRDADTDNRLRAIGWEPVRIWEHEDASDAANRILRLVRRRESIESARLDDRG